MKTAFNIALLVLLTLGIYSCRRKEALPVYADFGEIALQDPLQAPTQRPPFTVQLKDQTHEVTPLYSYSIAGMVVSCGFSRTLAEHRNDNLNIMDAGIIWGRNLDPGLYRNIRFHTDGVWLHARTKDQEVWEQLDQTRLSNNHLLSDDPGLMKKIRAIKRGDVVSVKGCLVSYSARGTSVNRNDSGNGACETIWVDEFEVLQDGTKFWYLLHRSSLYGIVALVALRVLLFFCITPRVPEVKSR